MIARLMPFPPAPLDVRAVASEPPGPQPNGPQAREVPRNFRTPLPSCEGRDAGPSWEGEKEGTIIFPRQATPRGGRRFHNILDSGAPGVWRP